MSYPFTSLSSKSGHLPGSTIHVGEKRAHKTSIDIVHYDGQELIGITDPTTDQLLDCQKKAGVSWIRVSGLHETNIIAEIGRLFHLHPLTVEDILNTNHRPKAEEFEDHLFITFRALKMMDNNLKQDQMSLVLGRGWVLSFEEQDHSRYATIIQHLEQHKGKARGRKSDYLFYRLIDVVVDDYFKLSEYFEVTNESLEDKVIRPDEKDYLPTIQRSKRQIFQCRKALMALREALVVVRRGNDALIHPSTLIYIEDVYEHTHHVIDDIEVQRDILASALDIYLSGQSNKMNQIMQVLTIISTIFIPLTFICGLYGMNFQFMPELTWRYGYFGVLLLMGIMAGIMLWLFRKKGWL
ncbi:magnesium/cobalt transporter CorA [Persicobacter psychrovividus]|uniref:Magnesium transport protein CorA n=1 Tax=Persicobacter psychrovividus TaxID=387638 RepID=A0ABM7VI51_9BACT|nr:magnesium and cobalt transport protein CorA [Persicobacter psychrovividus]